MRGELVVVKERGVSKEEVIDQLMTAAGIYIGQPGPAGAPAHPHRPSNHPGISPSCQPRIRLTCDRVAELIDRRS